LLGAGHNRSVATRKQRRRREKEKRHDYEIVYLDDEGNEVEPEEAEIRAPAKRSSTPAGKASKGYSSSGRRGRAPQPPSWRRVAKRGALFAPIFIATVLLLGGKHMNLAAALFQTLVLLVFFVPFSYFLDSFMWRSYQKKLGRGATSKR
jgi:hypothetical protein